MPRRGEKAPRRSKDCQQCAGKFLGSPQALFCTPCRKAKNATRARTKTAISRGEIIRKPCEVCGADKAHVHHEDYADLAAIVWLCPQDHWNRHRSMKIPLDKWLEHQRERAKWEPLEIRALGITHAIRQGYDAGWEQEW